MALILVVEDELVVAMHLQQSLERMGHVVVGTAATSDQAIRCATERCPDMVLMDVRIQGERDGIETAEILRMRFGVPVVYLTAHADDQTLRRAMITEPCGYLVKPFNEAGLRSAVELGLHRHAMETRLRQRSVSRREDGSERAVDDRTTPTMDPSGQVAGAVVAQRDVIEQKRLADQAIADRLASLGTLAAGLAHEINNPLTYLVLHAERTARGVAALEASGAPGAAGLRESVDAVRHAADRIARVIADLATFSEPVGAPAGGVDVRQSIEWALRSCAARARARAKLTTRLAPVPMVAADQGRLVQVITHLVTNAIEAIPEGASSAHEIELVTATDEAAKEVVITVRDTGRGISPDHLPRIFDPFFTTKTAGQGSGMGLSASHGIVTALGGRIALESTLGRGTTARVVLPASGPAARSLPLVAISDGASAATSSEPSTGVLRGRVLVVDDEPMVSRLMARMLEEQHSVIEAHGGADALRLLSLLGGFDVVLCDLMMPSVSGMDVYEECLQRDPLQARRIVFLTGGAYTARAAELLASVTNQRLTKPIPGEQLRKFVRAFLAEHGRHAS